MVIIVIIVIIVISVIIVLIAPPYSLSPLVPPSLPLSPLFSSIPSFRARRHAEYCLCKSATHNTMVERAQYTIHNTQHKTHDAQHAPISFLFVCWCYCCHPSAMGVVFESHFGSWILVKFKATELFYARRAAPHQP